LSAARVAKGTVYITIQNLLTSAMGIVFYFVAARVLPPRDIGAIATLQFSTAIYTTVALLSLQTTATKYISEEIGRGNPRVASAVASQTLRTVLVSALCIFFLAALSSPLLSTWLLGDPSKSIIFIVTFLSALFGVLKQMFVSFLQGVQRLDLFAKTHIIAVLVSSGVAVAAILLGYGLTGVVVAWLISQISAFLISGLFYRGCLPPPSEGYPISMLFRFAIPILLLGLIGLVSNWADRMIFLFLTGSLPDLGIYDLAVRGSMTLSIIPYAIGIAVLPAFSELYGRSGKRGMGKATELSTRYLAYLIFPAAIGLAAISETSMVFLFGEGYSRAGLPLAILSVAYIMTAYNVIFITALQAIGETRVFIKIGLATMITQTGLVTILSPHIGILGPTLARTAMQLVGLLYPLYALKKRIDVEIDTEAIVKAMAASMLMAVPVGLADRFLMNLLITPYRFILDLAFGVLLYLVLAVLLRLFEEKDLELLRLVTPPQFNSLLDLLGRLLLTRE